MNLISASSVSRSSWSARAEAVELREVDLADSPRLSPVGLWAATVAGWLAARQLLYC